MAQQLNQPNQLTRLRQATVATWIVGSIAFLAALAWAFGASISPQLPEITHPEPVAIPISDSALDGGLAAHDSGDDPLPGFARRFSPLPPPPETAPTPHSSPAPEPVIAQRLQLLGIARESGVLVAALYDPEDDRVHLVRDGDTLAGVEVRQVAERTVTLARGSRTRTIALHSPGTGGSPSRERRE